MDTKHDESCAIERLRIWLGFGFAIVGLIVCGVIGWILIRHDKHREAHEIVGIVGLFTSVTGTLAGAFLGMHIGSAHAENERRRRDRAEGIARLAIAHVDPEKRLELWPVNTNCHICEILRRWKSPKRSTA
jgi:hypothetical protein